MTAGPRDGRIASGSINRERGPLMQTPGGPLRTRRHFQVGFGLWEAGGVDDPCEPYFFAVGTLNKVKRLARAAGYTSLETANQVSHRTIKRHTIQL